jgi:hypothetical protein
MTERKLRPLWPLGFAVHAVAATLVLAIVLSSTSARWGLPYQDWMATSSAFMLQLGIAGPVSAAAAAYIAWRLCPRDRIFAHRLSGRPTWQVLWRHLSLLCGWCLGAYIVALAPLVVLTAARATDGGPDLRLILTGAVGLVAYAVLGYTTGAVFGSFLAVPVAFAVGMAVTVVGTSEMSPLSPVLSAAVNVGQRPAFALLLLRLVVILLVGVALLYVADSFIGGARRAPFAAVAMLVAAGGFVAVTARDQPRLRVDQANPPAVCTTDRTVQICVHRGHRKQLNEVRSGAARTLGAYGADSTYRVWDDALRGGSRPGTSYLWISADPAYVGEADLVAQDLAGQLVPSEACVKRDGLQLPTEVEQLYTYLQTWLSQGGRVDPAYDYPHLRRLGRTGLQRWLHEHRGQLDECTVDLSTLPR